ncbi:MAG: acyl-CoA dehydrogenase family protein [Acidimicrobiales bacterium]|nr:acyl-CoA dehydrogenase family protein [Acidimicrobiales bacterium]
MDLRYSESEQQFRKELREWLAETLPTLPPKPDPDDWPARRDYDTGWQRRLFDAGYAGINWPREFGGRGATLTEQLIFLEETTRAGAPYVGVNFVGLLHAGPTLMAEATDEQKATHLPRILRGEEVWCQGFSEPGAGSDLASLSCKAVRDGDEYVISGQKIWTSFAQVADYCELLVRTDPYAPKHKGITWLIFPMNTPGVEIRPLRTIVGSSEFSEVFFDEARVPVSNRVGAENEGWRIAMVTFSFERGTAFISDLVETDKMIGELVALARKVTRRSATAWDDVALRREVGHLQAEMDALWAMTKRNLAQAERNGVPGVGGSVVKLYYSELLQRLTDVAMRVLDRAGLAREDVGDLPSGAFVEERLRSTSFTIAAGTSQIQRNIIAERILGLPKDR